MGVSISKSFDLADRELASICDEAPLWSAPFGLLLLDTIKLRTGITVLDVGCGTGFPLIEMAQRLGPSCRLHGIDPWVAAIERAKTKLRYCGINNVELHEAVAEQLPFADDTFDLVVSNNGLNNVDDQARALGECYRVSRKDAQMVLTMNLPDTMKEFYTVYADLLRETGRASLIGKLQEHIASKRKPLTETAARIQTSGFEVAKVVEDTFRMRYSNGTALLKHFFIRLAFLDSWQGILPKGDVPGLFGELEQRLNHLAAQRGDLTLTVPFACFDCMKPLD